MMSVLHLHLLVEVLGIRSLTQHNKHQAVHSNFCVPQAMQDAANAREPILTAHWLKHTEAHWPKLGNPLIEALGCQELK